MQELFIPTLHTFAMDNIFTGSCDLFRFRAVPNIVKKNPKEVDLEASSITAEFWHGPFCYEKSQMEGSETFPMSEDGRSAMKAWLEENI
ncbi:MAG: hypothetical protein IJO28_08275 [Oscillospiraceae bacterium]|nr:hypothetical protein [Oscillospiraceae bacterium]